MVDEILNVYPIGNMAFNVPESVGIDETFTVRLILSPRSLSQTSRMSLIALSTRSFRQVKFG